MKFVVALSLLTTLIAYSESCSCTPKHPQVQFCDADFVTQIRLRSLGRSNKDNSETVIDHVRYYSVRINKIFKLVDNDYGFNENTTVAKMVTPAYESVCGVTLEENTKYVVSGKFNEEGLMNLDLCSSLILPWPHVTKRMKKNLQFRYQPNCGCTVIDSDSDETKNSCVWKSHRKDADCYSRHSTCIADINSTTGGCKWHRNRHLKKCRAESAKHIWEP